MARWLAVPLIALMLACGAFNGATFLAHCHGEHGVHLHPIGLLDDCDQLADVPCGLIVSLDVDKQLPRRSLDLGKTLSPETIFAMVAFVWPASPGLDRHVGSPGGALNRGPMDLLALRAGDRLVRTSRALLI